jgi:hypothetical protein
MNAPRSTKQTLADLSGRSVNGISMQRLAPMFARRVVERREAEARYDADNYVHPAFVDHLRAKAAKALEKEAENTAPNLPISSVFDALQITKQHKRANNDAGIRAWQGMLTSMWKQNRTANISANSFMKLKTYFTDNFPKSAVSEVFDEIGAQGYAALPVAELLTIASRIYDQEDYEFEMRSAGLTTQQPHHVKARKFVLAVLNGEEGPEEDIDTSFGFEEMGGYDEDDEDYSGPGKFEGVAQEDQKLVRELYGERADQETGDSSGAGGGWYGLYLGYGEGPAVILYESTDGFIDYEKFDSDEEAEAKFAELDVEYGDEYDDEYDTY